MTRSMRGSFAGALLAALLLAACGGGDDDASGDGAGEAQEAAGPEEPNPLDVTLELDAARTGRAAVGPKGGVVEATGADGTTFHLDIPAGAVADTTEITLTPVTGMDPQPMSGGLNAGAQLGPDGLHLGVLATLTIRPADPPDHDAAMGVAWSGEGENVSLTGLEGGPDEIVLRLSHFSGVAVGEGTGEDAGRLRDQAAEICAYQFESAIRMDVAGAEWSQTWGNDVPPDLDDVAAQLVGWFDACVEPRLEEGKGSDEALEVGLSEYVRWLSVAQLLGVDGRPEVAERNETGKALAEDGLVAALERASEDCASAHDLTTVRRMVRWVSIGQLFGFEDEALTSDALDARVRSCLTFEVRYDATFRLEIPEIGPATETMDGAVVVSSGLTDAVENGQIVLEGGGPIGVAQTGYDRFISELGETFFQGFALAGEVLTGTDLPDQYTNPDLTSEQFYGCTVSDPAPAGATPRITGIPLSAGPAGAPDLTMPVTAAEMPVSCPAPVGGFPFPTLYFSMIPEVNPERMSGNALHLVGWTPGSGATWGTIGFSGRLSEGGFVISHDTTVELVHAAGAPATTAPGGGIDAFAPVE